MITCMFSCKVCGLDRIKVQVPARETPDLEKANDVVAWVNRTAQLLGEEHSRLRPDCPARELDIYLPIEGAEFIGQQVE